MKYTSAFVTSLLFSWATIQIGDFIGRGREVVADNRFFFWSAFKPDGSAKRAEVSFDIWNPAGDGIQDDYKKLVAALDYAKNNNVDLVLNSTKTYYIGTRLNYSFMGVLRIKSSDANKRSVIKLSDAYLFPFQLNATQKPGSAAVTTQLNAGQKSVVVTNGSGFAAGDYVGFASSADWPLANNSDVQKGEWNIVESVAGNVLLLRYPVKDTYPVSERVTLSKWLYASLDLSGVEFVCNDSGNRPTVGLSLRNLQNSRVTNCIVRNFQTTGVETRACFNVEFANNQVFGANEVGMGYGFCPLAGFKYIVHDNTFTGGRKGVDVSGAGALGPARDVKIYRNTTYGSGSTATGTDWFNLDVVGGQNMGYAVHEGAEDVLFTDNASYNTCYGYQIRGKDVTVKNNTVYGLCNFPFTTVAGSNHLYEGNEYKSLLANKAAQPTAGTDYSKYPRSLFISDASGPGPLIVRNNKTDFARDFGVVLDGGNVLADVLVTGNQCLFSTIDGSSAPSLVYWSHIKKPVNKLVSRSNSGTMAASGINVSTMRLVRDASYKTGALLNWDTCEVEGLRADDVLTLSADNATAPLTYNLAGLKIDKQGQTARITGKISFKSPVSCKPLLMAVPIPAPGTADLFTFDCATDQKSYVGKLYQNSTMQFGRSGSTFTNTYLPDTDYTLVVNVPYRTN